MASDINSKYDEYIDIKIITGEHLYILGKNVVGYCHYVHHKGYITKTLLKSHKCLSKQCHYFEKYSNHPYWEAQDNIQKAKERKKEARKKQKQEEHDKNEQWIKEAQKTADALGYPMKIVSVRKTPGKKHFMIFYISDIPKNDWYRFAELAKEFGKQMRARAELRHIKDLDGNYVTI